MYNEDEYFEKISVVEKVIDKPFFEDLYFREPFVCSLLLDKFKTYLDDSNVDKLERQLLLIRFLKNNYPLELSREVVEFVSNCKFSSDYVKVIMEWNYQCSDFIKQYNLAQYDAVQLAFDRQTKYDYDDHIRQRSKQFDIVNDITRSLIYDEDENSGKK